MAVLSEEQTMLRDMAREWTKNESPVTAWRKVRDENGAGGFDAGVYGEMAQMGWAGIVIPEAYGGSDFGWLSLGLVLEELGKTVTASPLAASAVAASAIVLGGSDAQKQKWLPGIAAGEIVAALAVDEGPRHAPETVKASVSGGKLTGTKAFVAEGDSAGLFVVAATDGLYLVAGDAAGVSRSRRELTDFRSHAEVTFKDAPAEKLADGGDTLLDQVLDRARVLAAAEMLGLSGQAFETTLDYLKQRVQFGQVLATFQALQHRMAGLFSDIELMRSAVEAGLSAIDGGGDTRQAALLAKTKANEVGHLMSREMIQLHGGIGMTDEYDAGFYLKRMRVLEQIWGNTAYLRDRFATLSGF
jgi:alkylation response protein AidB-like acyl-CoA dehydrogenase